MLIAAVVAIVWANSPWSDSYTEFWETPLRVELGDLLHLDHLSLQAWVNDALMTVFFLLVGVEIKREVVHGELRDPRAVALPVVAAARRHARARPPSTPPSTRAARAATGGPSRWPPTSPSPSGVVTLAGKRVPLAAKIFLLTLAVADDIGAIVVIAVFYTGSLSWGWFACALVGARRHLRAAPQRRAEPGALPGGRRLRLAGPARVGRARHAGRRGPRPAHAGLAAAVAPPVPARGPQDPQQRRGRLLRPRAHPGGVRRERAAHRRGRRASPCGAPARSSASSGRCRPGSPTWSCPSSPSPTPACRCRATPSAGSSPTPSPSGVAARPRRRQDGRRVRLHGRRREARRRPAPRRHHVAPRVRAGHRRRRRVHGGPVRDQPVVRRRRRHRRGQGRHPVRQRRSPASSATRCCARHRPPPSRKPTTPTPTGPRRRRPIPSSRGSTPPARPDRAVRARVAASRRGVRTARHYRGRRATSGGRVVAAATRRHDADRRVRAAACARPHPLHDRAFVFAAGGAGSAARRRVAVAALAAVALSPLAPAGRTATCWPTRCRPSRC